MFKKLLTEIYPFKNYYIGEREGIYFFSNGCGWRWWLKVFAERLLIVQYIYVCG